MIYYSEKTGGIFTQGALDELKMKGLTPPPVREITVEEYRRLSKPEKK